MRLLSSSSLFCTILDEQILVISRKGDKKRISFARDSSAVRSALILRFESFFRDLGSEKRIDQYPRHYFRDREQISSTKREPIPWRTSACRNRPVWNWNESRLEFGYNSLETDLRGSRPVASATYSISGSKFPPCGPEIRIRGEGGARREGSYRDTNTRKRSFHYRLRRGVSGAWSVVCLRFDKSMERHEVIDPFRRIDSTYVNSSD